MTRAGPRGWARAGEGWGAAAPHPPIRALRLPQGLTQSLAGPGPRSPGQRYPAVAERGDVSLHPRSHSPRSRPCRGKGRRGVGGGEGAPPGNQSCNLTPPLRIHPRPSKRPKHPSRWKGEPGLSPCGGVRPLPLTTVSPGGVSEAAARGRWEGRWWQGSCRQRGWDFIAYRSGGTTERPARAPRPSRAVTPKGNGILPAQHRLVSAIGFLWPRGKA